MCILRAVCISSEYYYENEYNQTNNGQGLQGMNRKSLQPVKTGLSLCAQTTILIYLHTL